MRAVLVMMWDGERSDVGRPDDTPDGKLGAELIAALVQFIAEQRGGQWCVDKTGGDGG